MFNQETIKYSLRNLKQRKGRSFLTLFSILIGIATIFIFVSFGWGLFNYVDEFKSGSSVDKLLITGKGGFGGLDAEESFKLTEDDVDAVKGAAGVYDASGVYFTTVQAEVNNQKKFVFLIAYDPKTPLILDIIDIGAEKGRLLRSGDTKNVLLGYNYLFDNKIFKRGLDINNIIEIDGEKMKIIGFFESVGNPQDDSQIYIINEYFEDLYPNKTYFEIVARVDITNIERVIENVEKKLRKERGLEEGKEDFFVQSFEELLKSFSAVLNIIIGFIILIALISVLVSAVNTANTMITSVLERYKEIGILKAIGARNSDVFWIFLFESSFLGFVAGVLGVLLGWGFSSLAGSILTNLGWGFLSPYYSPYLFIGSVLFATLTGAISGVIPAVRASKINTVDALRHE